MRRSTPSFHIVGPVATALLALVLLGAVVAGAQTGADAVFQNFQPSGEFSVQLDGQELENGELFHAERAGAYLIMAPELTSPVLINTRTRLVETVSLLKVSKRDNGVIDLLADASFSSLGPFAIGANQLSFDYKGQKVTLAKKPPLTGLHPPAALVEHNPAYGFKAGQYEADGGQLAKLRQQGKNVQVRVYFGNWCPVCSRLVPKVIKIEEALEGSKVSFEYYGLPQPMSDDPIAAEKKVHGVPTAIVYVDGAEKGRLNGRDLYKPEASLLKLLSGA